MSSPATLLLVAGVVAAHLVLFVAGYHLYVLTIPADGGTVLQAADAGVFAANDRTDPGLLDDEDIERVDNRPAEDENDED